MADKKYFLEMREDGVRLPIQNNGYFSLDEARKAALKKVDDALPRNTVHVLLEVGYAYCGGDGGEYFKE
jgi:hypothetical protein